MIVPAKKRAVYDDLYGIPENMTGEIIDGELIVTPRPSRKHVYTTSALETKVAAHYQFGEGGGPGGWIILVEPEIGLGENILVPDLAGWKRERFPIEEPHNWISVAPDWVCEILSPSTALIDRVEKMPLYAQHQVSHAWLIDPVLKTLEVFKFESGRWVVLGVYAKSATAHAEPFLDIALNLGLFWLE
jgi:Uma2 family endonuclease